MNKNRRRVFSLKFKSMDDGTEDGKRMDDGKLSKNIFEFDKSVVLCHCQRTRRRIFPPLKFKSIDDGTLDDGKIIQEYI